MSSKYRFVRSYAALLVCAPLLVVACGSDDDDSGGKAGSAGTGGAAGSGGSGNGGSGNGGSGNGGSGNGGSGNGGSGNGGSGNGGSGAVAGSGGSSAGAGGSAGTGGATGGSGGATGGSGGATGGSAGTGGSGGSGGATGGTGGATGGTGGTGGTTGGTGGTGGGATANLYFSEYIEGSGNNKALEIYNAGPDQDLALCQVRLYVSAGSTASTTLSNMTGTLKAGEVFVICNSRSNSTVKAVCDLESGVANFNGDDAVDLICNGDLQDVIGQIGTDPGSRWGTGSVTTEDHTLRRKCSVTTGDTNPGDAFDPATEWDGFTQDDFTNLGLVRSCP